MNHSIAIITLGDVRKAFFEKRLWIVEKENTSLENLLAPYYELYMPGPVFSVKEAQAVSKEIRKRDITAIVIHIPIWGTPSHAEPIVNDQYPCILLGNNRKDSSSMVSMLATAGMLEQSGKKILRVFGDLDDYKTAKKLKDSIQLCLVLNYLRNSRFCLIGGQSIGIGTTVADPPQWQKLWGICSDHLDQLEVVMRAEQVPLPRVVQVRTWLQTFGGIKFCDSLSEDNLEKQIRSYLAIKDIMEQGGYTFIALKCQQELSDWYALQCLSISLLNNTFDHQGQKEVIPCACEGDCDGALTMLILHAMDTSQPSCLVDIRSYDEETKEFTFANCGGMAIAYANLTDNEDAKQKTQIMPHMFGKAGGGTTQFMTQEGIVTAARLFRKNNSYYMIAFEALSIMKARTELKANTCYPHAFLKADIDFDRFMQSMGSNHMHFIFGSHLDSLKTFCEVSSIEFINCMN